jgi:hypothetical protein
MTGDPQAALKSALLRVQAQHRDVFKGRSLCDWAILSDGAQYCPLFSPPLHQPWSALALKASADMFRECQFDSKRMDYPPVVCPVYYASFLSGDSGNARQHDAAAG